MDATCLHRVNSHVPTTPAVTEAKRTPSFASARIASEAKASSLMKMAMVKPNPDSTEIATMCPQFTSVPSFPQPNFTKVQLIRSKPIGLPSTYPSITPMVTGPVIAPAKDAGSSMPALASANSGRTRKATQGCNACSNRCKGDPA